MSNNEMTNKPMTPERLAEIRGRVTAAMRDAVQVEHEYSTGQRAVCVPNLNECAAWWELIEHAPADILALLDALALADADYVSLEGDLQLAERCRLEEKKRADEAETQIESLQDELARRDAYAAKQIEHSRAVKENIK